MLRRLPLCFVAVVLHLGQQALTYNDLQGCTVQDVTYNCSGAEFDQVPLEEDLPSAVEVLDLSNNHIDNVTDFNVPWAAQTLNTLYLSNNKISIIKPRSFSLLTNLVYLDLSNNVIEGSKLEEHMFHDLRKLKTLNLEKNPLRIIKTNTFNFIQIPLLIYLDLSHCDISVLERSSIDLPNLEYLDLKWNQLDKLNVDAFRMMTNLKTLDVSFNNIRVLEQVPFLPEIVALLVENNGLEEVKLRDEIWTSAESLQKLSLRNNQIIRFDRESLPLDLDTLVDIDLSNNLIQCDCKMTWIKSEEVPREDRNITIPCKYPKDLRGRNILDVPTDEFKCEVPLVHILLLVLLVVLVVLCAVLMFFFLTRKRCRRGKGRSKVKKTHRADAGGDYTAVYSKDDDDDVTVEFSDNKRLINEAREFDV